MARAGILLYLMFAVAAGPSLCCCSSDRLLTRLDGAKHLKTTGNRCCNQHAKGGNNPAPGDTKHPEAPQPGQPCQCPNGVLQPITFSSDKSFPTDSTRPVALSQEFGPGVFCMGEVLSWHPPAENAGFAFASPVQNPRDILSVLQSLLC